MTKVVESEVFESCPFASILPRRTPRLPRLVIPGHEHEIVWSLLAVRSSTLKHREDFVRHRNRFRLVVLRIGRQNRKRPLDQIDILTGSAGDDWFLFNSNEDKATGVSKTESPENINTTTP